MIKGTKESEVDLFHCYLQATSESWVLIKFCELFFPSENVDHRLLGVGVLNFKCPIKASYWHYEHLLLTQSIVFFEQNFVFFPRASIFKSLFL